MYENSLTLTIFIFSLTIIFMLWKPRGINEAIPTSIGAAILLTLGIVPYTDILEIFNIVSGASFTILSTIIMSIVLESVGFFRWVAINILNKVNGSGIRLFIYINLLCYLTTLFFNNDGSILITTPIIINLVTMLQLKPHQKIPFLLSGALVATASSAPIAVSNIANLIALKIVGLDLNSYVTMMFVPSMIGIFTMVGLLFIYFRKDIPRSISKGNFQNKDFSKTHPLADSSSHLNIDWKMFKTSILIVVIIRGSYFALSPFGVPIELIAIIGALLLLLYRWKLYGTGVKDVIHRTPWHILLFAFSMYVIVFALKNVGLTSLLVNHLGGLITSNDFNSILTMGILLTIMSNLVNNLPSVMIGTVTLMEMNLDLKTLQVSYLANIIGSDVGALLTPVGTLATLIWMFILRKNGIHLPWYQYIKVTIMIIPITLLVSLISLYLWTEWIF